MKAISIKQPWAHLIAAGIKDIENRTWKCPEKYIGKRVLIHASKTQYETPMYLLTDEQYDSIKQEKRIEINNSLEYGCIIGSIEIVDCVVNHTSIWAEKTKLPTVGDVLEDIHFLGKVQNPDSIIYNWVLANPILFDEPILGIKGKLGFWEYEFDENTFECTNNNPYTHDSCGEKQGCIQHCDDCDYYKSKYE